jgi:hypothetical protein
MASKHQVKQYLAYWLQLGKKVLIRNGEEVLFLPSVIEGDRYSQEFERCWEKVLLPESGDCYIDGTNETIAELLTSVWEITPCGRCSMPVAIRQVGMPPLWCPCHNLLSWPNTELPAPRSPVDSQACLIEICDRLMKVNTAPTE